MLRGIVTSSFQRDQLETSTRHEAADASWIVGRCGVFCFACDPQRYPLGHARLADDFVSGHDCVRLFRS